MKMATEIGEAKFVLIDEANDVFETFESEEELEEYLEEEGYDEDEVEDLRVFKIETEYKVNADSSYELEEV